MARPRFTTDAYRDLDEIVVYVGARNPAAAGRLTDRLEAISWSLARDSGIGQPRPDLAPGLRFFPVENYLIFYREEPDGIQVIRVLHGSRSYSSRDF